MARFCSCPLPAGHRGAPAASSLSPLSRPVPKASPGKVGASMEGTPVRMSVWCRHRKRVDHLRVSKMVTSWRCLLNSLLVYYWKMNFL